jgi:hypothetical protein
MNVTETAITANVLGFTPVAMGMSEQLGQDFHPIYSNNNDKLF